MLNVTLSDYYCGDEEIRFSYFCIPRQLITHPCFKPLSADAKLLYGMLLNRMSLSAKKWLARQHRAGLYLLYCKRGLRDHRLRAKQGHAVIGRDGHQQGHRPD